MPLIFCFSPIEFEQRLLILNKQQPEGRLTATFVPRSLRRGQTCAPVRSVAEAGGLLQGVVGSSPTGGAKKKASRETCFFLSNPKDWYGITRRVYGIRRKATAWHHASACILLRIDYIQHFVLIPYRRQAADFIHGFAVILRVAFLYYEHKK